MTRFSTNSQTCYKGLLTQAKVTLFTFHCSNTYIHFETNQRYFVTFWDLSVTDESFGDETRVWRKNKFSPYIYDEFTCIQRSVIFLALRLTLIQKSILGGFNVHNHPGWSFIYG